MTMSYPARADIDLDAFRANLSVARAAAATSKVMAIVKADAYGHGRAECARAALAEGADYLGVAQLGEALELRREVGAGPRILTWIYAPMAPVQDAIEADIDLSVGALWALDAVVAAARALGRPARIHLKVDTGMSRGGFCPEDVPDVASIVRAHELAGDVVVVGLWSHLARADEPGGEFTDTQVTRFERARADVARAGIEIKLHHLAASSGTLWHPETHYDMVRPGICLYGLSPNPAWATAAELGLRAAMTLSATMIVDREVEAGTGISYGHIAVTEARTRLGVVPLGYGDGIDRKASNVAPVVVGGQRTRVIGRVCMDQFMVSLPGGVGAGDTAWLFGDAGAGLPTADDWGEAIGTIGYEVVTRLGARVPRNYHGSVER